MDSKSLFQLNSILPKYYFKKEAMQSKVISDPRVFPIDVKKYCFLNDFNQSIRSIFIDDSGTIYPSSQDKNIRLGEFRKADEFEKIVENRIHLPYAQLTKNKINKCRVCEYRKICTNTLCHRESYEQLESSPTNCLYNP
jgi:radical SAM protein with 4Fe4S-binding SPASM domain